MNHCIIGLPRPRGRLHGLPIGQIRIDVFCLQYGTGTKYLQCSITLSGNTSVSRDDQSHRNIQLLYEFPAEIIPDATQQSRRSGRANPPHSGTVPLRFGQNIQVTVVEAQQRIIGRRNLIFIILHSGMAPGLRTSHLHLHIRLTAQEPDFADQDIPEFHLLPVVVESNRVRRISGRCGRNIHREAPKALAVDRRREFSVVPVDRHSYGFPGRALSPKGQGTVLLHNHIRTQYAVYIKGIFSIFSGISAGSLLRSIFRGGSARAQCRTEKHDHSRPRRQ